MDRKTGGCTKGLQTTGLPGVRCRNDLWLDGPADYGTLERLDGVISLPDGGTQAQPFSRISFRNAHRIQQAASCFPGDPEGH